MRLARPPRGQEGKHLRFSPSCQSTPFPLGRAARAGVSDAFRLPPNCCCDRHGIDCHPRGSALPRGVESALLVALGKWVAGALVLRTLRAKRALICGSKCRKSSGKCLSACSPPKGKGVIRKRGETLVSPLLCACRAQRPASRRPQAAKSPASEVQAYAKSASAAPFHWARDARPYGVHAHPKYITAAASSRLSAPRR